MFNSLRWKIVHVVLFQYFHVRLTHGLTERLEVFSRSQTIFDEALDPPIAFHTPYQPLGNQSIPKQQVLRWRSAKPYETFSRDGQPRQTGPIEVTKVISLRLSLLFHVNYTTLA